MGTILVSLVLVTIVALIITSMVRAKKTGKSCCSGKCSCCSKTGEAVCHCK